MNIQLSPHPWVRSFVAVNGLIWGAAVQAGPMSGSAALGVVVSGGNTQSQSQNAEYSLRYELAETAWVVLSSGKVLQSSSAVEIEKLDGTTRSDTQITAENYHVDLRAERTIDDSNYVFGQADFDKDLFAAVRTSTSQTLGYGRRLIAQEQRSLDLEFGAGARQQEDQSTRATRDEFIGELGLRFQSVLGESSEISQLLSVQYGEDNTVVDSQTRLKLTIIGALAAQLGFDLRNNSETGPDEKSTDTTTSISLLWSFGKAE